LDNDIIRFAHQVKDGKGVGQSFLSTLKPEHIDLRPFKQRVSKDKAAMLFAMKIKKELYKEFDPIQDIMLCPQNVGFGSIEINNNFAQVFGDLRQALVWEVIAGFKKKYFAVGDKVMFNKRDYIIKEIKVNGNYVGATPKLPSRTLNRWGQDFGGHEGGWEDLEDQLSSGLDIDLEDTKVDDKVNQASAILVLDPIQKMYEGEEVIEVRTAGEINATEFSYCISVHKAQGSEWGKVYLVLHNSHTTMLSRELLYTAITRARHKLVVFYDPESGAMKGDGSLDRAVKNVQIKGITWQQKAQAFKGKIETLPEHILEELESTGDGR
jgi:hypothetical protein